MAKGKNSTKYHCPRESKGGCGPQVKAPNGKKYCSGHETYCHHCAVIIRKDYTYLIGQHCKVCFRAQQKEQAAKEAERKKDEQRKKEEKKNADAKKKK